MNNKHKKLIKNTIIIFIGKFCTQFISFLLVPIFTKYLNTSDYGYVELVHSYITLITPIILLRIDSAAFRFLIDTRDNKEKNRTIISSVTFITLFQLIIFLIVSSIINLITEIRFFNLIVIDIIALSIFTMTLQIARGYGKNTQYTVASVICGILNVAITTILIICANFDSSAILFASIVSNLAGALYLLSTLKIHRETSRKSVNKREIKKIIKYSLPMIPDGLSWWVCNVADRTVISFMAGNSLNGIYAISSKFANIIQSASGVFNISWQESASIHINEKDKNKFFSSVFNNSLTFFASITIILLIIMPIAFRIMVNNDYTSAYLYIPILLLANLFSAQANVIGAIYIAKKNTKKAARSTMICAAINTIINVLLIKKYQLWAASISTLISYVILCIYRYIDTRKDIDIKINIRRLLTIIVSFSIIIAFYYLKTTLSIIVNIAIGSAIVLYLNYPHIKDVFKQIKKRK